MLLSPLLMRPAGSPFPAGRISSIGRYVLTLFHFADDRGIIDMEYRMGEDMDGTSFYREDRELEPGERGGLCQRRQDIHHGGQRL